MYSFSYICIYVIQRFNSRVQVYIYRLGGIIICSIQINERYCSHDLRLKYSGILSQSKDRVYSRVWDLYWEWGERSWDLWMKRCDIVVNLPLHICFSEFFASQVIGTYTESSCGQNKFEGRYYAVAWKWFIRAENGVLVILFVVIIVIINAIITIIIINLYPIESRRGSSTTSVRSYGTQHRTFQSRLQNVSVPVLSSVSITQYASNFRTTFR